MTDHPIRSYPDELRERAEADTDAIANPPIVGLAAPTCPEHTDDAVCPCPPGCYCRQPEPGDLTAEEARDLADDLGLQLYRAQDALAFVAECCDIADREGRTITVADVREWLKGAQCGRQLAASNPVFVLDPNAPPLEFVTWSGPHFTYRPVTPEIEAAATTRAVQAAADSEKTAAWFKETGGVLGAPAATEATDTPDMITDPEWLRQQYAAALREHGMVHLGDQVPADEYDCCADAVLAVRDRHLLQLRQRLTLADADLDRYEEHVVGDLNEANIALARQAARAEQQRDQLADDLRYVLDYRGPGHAHEQPGVWDTSGKPCDHCARLEQARQHLTNLTPTEA